MKNTLIIFLLFTCTIAKSQQFKFYLAFEDADNYTDTAWFVWDNSATFQLDSTFGETPQIMPTDDFQVFFKHFPFDTIPYYTKVFSAPSSSKTFTAQLNANMIGTTQDAILKLPLKISWDTLLMKNNSLPFEIKLAGMFCYALTENDGISDNIYFDLFSQNSAIIPIMDEVTNHAVFPMRVFFSAWSLGYEDLTSGSRFKKDERVKIYERINLNRKDNDIYIDNGFYNNVKIFDVSGILIKEFKNPREIIHTNFIKPGFYKIVLENNGKYFFDYIVID